MKKNIFLLASFIMLGYLIGTFFGGAETINRFGLPISIGVQRILLAISSVGFYYLFTKEKSRLRTHKQNGTNEK